jgi:hypothetical protein
LLNCPKDGTLLLGLLKAVNLCTPGSEFIAERGKNS